MGKARGRGGGKPRNPRPKRAGDPDSSSEEETSFKPTQRGLGEPMSGDLHFPQFEFRQTAPVFS